MEFNIRNAVKERCETTFERIANNSPYFNYETFRNELIKETESILEKIKPRVNLSMTTNENDLHIGFDNSIDIISLTQSQVNAAYLFLIETINYLNEFNETLETPPTKTAQRINSSSTQAKDYKKSIWFKTGIPLATGEAFDLYRKYKNDKGHFKKICLELGFKEGDRPYFSETINGTTDNDKNTFANKDKLQKLHKHLAENGLEFGTEFLIKFNAIEPE